LNITRKDVNEAIEILDTVLSEIEKEK